MVEDGPKVLTDQFRIDQTNVKECVKKQQTSYRKLPLITINPGLPQVALQPPIDP